MGILDDLRHKAEELGEKAREGLDVARDKAGEVLDGARDKAGDLVEDVKDRLGDDGDGDRAPTTESEDVGPDSSSTDAVQPGYVTGEDAEGEGAEEETSGEDADEASADGGTEPDAASDELVPDAEDLGDVDPDADGAPAATAGGSSELVQDPDDADDADDAGDAGDAPFVPVATEVDPYDQPLSESIGSELSDADRAALAGAVDPGDGAGTTDRDS